MTSVQEVIKKHHIPQAPSVTFETFPLRLNFRQPGFRAKKGELNIPRSFIKK